MATFVRGMGERGVLGWECFVGGQRWGAGRAVLEVAGGWTGGGGGHWGLGGATGLLVYSSLSACRGVGGV